MKEGFPVPRETFGSRLGMLLTLVGAAVGLGNVWRFPYMVGKFGGASFVLFYSAAVVLIGIPALMAEWTLGRHTRRGPAGAYARAGMPGGRFFGWLFFGCVLIATGYYTNAIGWVLYFAVGEVAQLFALPWARGAILPPQTGFDASSFIMQLVATGLIILAGVVVLRRGLRQGIERASRLIMPILFISLLVLITRALTLEGAGEGVRWYILKLEPRALKPSVMLAALGHACFSLSLGGTFMVIYGSYLDPKVPLRSTAAWTAAGDLLAGLLAGLAIMPAVFAFGLEPSSGPGLIFETLPKVFMRLPLGSLFGIIFFGSLLGAAYLSDLVAFEVLIAGVCDNMGLSRQRAVNLVAAAVFLGATPPMLNMRIFSFWDLAFGSGLQTVGVLLAVLTVGWCLARSTALGELASGAPDRGIRWLYLWLRFVIPGAILSIGAWWLMSDVLRITGVG